MTQDLYFAAGCFWGAQKFFAKVKGVTFTEVGFANGFTENPTYKEVYTDQTGYAETVHLQYDTDIITEERLTELFLRAIDPLSLNKQGEDEGTRYRTGVYFVNEAQVPGISAALDRCAAALGQPLAVELLPLQNFYRAEEYHQDYLEKNPNGYCHLSPAIFRIAEEAYSAHVSQVHPRFGPEKAARRHVCVHGYVKIHGGGWYEKDDARKTITLYGGSGDYGEPRLLFLNRIPRELEEYDFYYTPIHGLPGNKLDLTDVEWF